MIPYSRHGRVSQNLRKFENLQLRLLLEERLIKKCVMEVKGGESTAFFVSRGGFQCFGGFGFTGRELQNNNLSRFGGSCN
jgi:hypothetical protein